MKLPITKRPYFPGIFLVFEVYKRMPQGIETMCRPNWCYRSEQHKRDQKHSHTHTPTTVILPDKSEQVVRDWKHRMKLVIQMTPPQLGPNTEETRYHTQLVNN